MPPIRIGTELIDTRDGRTCIVGEVLASGVLLVRKRSLTTGRWQTIRGYAGRFRRAATGKPLYRVRQESLDYHRAKIRDAARERYGDDVVRLAEGTGLTYRQVWEERHGV